MNTYRRMDDPPWYPRWVQISCGEGVMASGFYKDGHWHNDNGAMFQSIPDFIGWIDYDPEERARITKVKALFGVVI